MVQVKVSVLFVLQVLAAAIALARPATQRTSNSRSPSPSLGDQPQLPSPKSPSTSSLSSHQQQAPSNPPVKIFERLDPEAHEIFDSAIKNTFLARDIYSPKMSIANMDNIYNMKEEIQGRWTLARQSNPNEPTDHTSKRLAKEFEREINARIKLEPTPRRREKLPVLSYQPIKVNLKGPSESLTAKFDDAFRKSEPLSSSFFTPTMKKAEMTGRLSLKQGEAKLEPDASEVQETMRRQMAKVTSGISERQQAA